MLTLTIEEAQSHLAEIIEKLPPGEEVVLTGNGEPLARLVKTGRSSWPCQAGSAKDKILWIASDFDAPLEEF
jgi:antitoxin (DNA-binding transcriptional repressor) of toxin-antitoxin stability system